METEETVVEEVIEEPIGEDGLTQAQRSEARALWVKADETEQAAWLRRVSAQVTNSMMVKPTANTTETVAAVKSLYVALLKIRMAVQAQEQHDYQVFVDKVRQGK